MGLISISPIPGEALVSSILNIGQSIIARLFPDPAEAAKAQLELLRMQQTGELASLAADTQLLAKQLDINKAEAETGSLFIGGWRPFIGWTCGLSLFVQFIGMPLAGAYVAFKDLKVVLPTFDFGPLMGVVIPLLGIGMLRTYEKVKGVSSDGKMYP
jgi:hypothetical protein